jgi:hypothetical protein
VSAVKWIEQVGFSYKKLEADPALAERLTRESYDRFLVLEASMRNTELPNAESEFAPLIDTMKAYATQLFREFDPSIERLHPRMGPGATSDIGVSLPHEKYFAGTDSSESRFFDDELPDDCNFVGAVTRVLGRNVGTFILPSTYSVAEGRAKEACVVGTPVLESEKGTIGLVPYPDLPSMYSTVDDIRETEGRGAGARRVKPTGSRLMAVPKDNSKMRTIAPEPVSKGIWQLAVNDRFKEYLEGHKASKGHINFTHQTINQQLALEHSDANSVAIRKPRMRLASIDLSDASDRIRWDLVKRVFPKKVVTLLSAVRSQYMWIPKLRGMKSVEEYGITGYRVGEYAPFETSTTCCEPRKLAIRRRMTRVKSGEQGDGRWIRLCKHASMGSGACFPVLAVVCYLMAAAVASRRSHFKKRLRGCTRDVYVYGDDIFLPCVDVPQFVSLAESLGLKVNVNKSYSDGFYRESCGVDAYLGYDVTPVRVRHHIPTGEALTTRLTRSDFVGCKRLADFRSVISEHRRIEKMESERICGWFETVGLFHDRGMLNTYNTAIKLLLEHLPYIPIVPKNRGVIGVQSKTQSGVITDWGDIVYRRDNGSYVRSKPVVTYDNQLHARILEFPGYTMYVDQYELNKANDELAYYAWMFQRGSNIKNEPPGFDPLSWPLVTSECRRSLIRANQRSQGGRAQNMLDAQLTDLGTNRNFKIHRGVCFVRPTLMRVVAG